MKKTFILFLFLLVSFSFAQKAESKKLDEFFKILEDNHKVMGSFAIYKDHQMIYTKTIGFADIEKNTKPNVNTKYRIGSISKTFTAVLVMQAVEKNKLNLNDKLSKYFPEIKNADKISIEDLMRHRSGIFNFTDNPQYESLSKNAVSERELLKLIQNGGSNFEPNSKFEYSNSNYALLALIVEKVEKKTYSELINAQIIKPIGLKYTTVDNEINSSKNQAFSYFYKDGKYEKSAETNLSIAIGAGNISSTPSDLIKFIDALQNGKLVSEASLSKMKIVNDHFGLGIFEVPFDGKMGFGHNGSIDEFRSVLYYFPHNRTAFAMVTNQSSFDNNKISIAAMSFANNMEVELPNFKIIQIPVEELNKFIGVYSSKSFPLKIEFFVKENVLYSRATGQSEFPLKATSQNSFVFEEAGITLSFDTEKRTMSFSQGRNSFVLTKE